MNRPSATRRLLTGAATAGITATLLIPVTAQADEPAHDTTPVQPASQDVSAPETLAPQDTSTPQDAPTSQDTSLSEGASTPATSASPASDTPASQDIPASQDTSAPQVTSTSQDTSTPPEPDTPLTAIDDMIEDPTGAWVVFNVLDNDQWSDGRTVRLTDFTLRSWQWDPNGPRSDRCRNRMVPDYLGFEPSGQVIFSTDSYSAICNGGSDRTPTRTVVFDYEITDSAGETATATATIVETHMHPVPNQDVAGSGLGLYMTPGTSKTFKVLRAGLQDDATAKVTFPEPFGDRMDDGERSAGWIGTRSADGTRFAGEGWSAEVIDNEVVLTMAPDFLTHQPDRALTILFVVTDRYGSVPSEFYINAETDPTLVAVDDAVAIVAGQSATIDVLNNDDLTNSGIIYQVAVPESGRGWSASVVAENKVRVSVSEDAQPGTKLAVPYRVDTNRTNGEATIWVTVKTPTTPDVSDPRSKEPKTPKREEPRTPPRIDAGATYAASDAPAAQEQDSAEWQWWLASPLLLACALLASRARRQWARQ